MAAPIPLEAPVTRATLPDKSIMNNLARNRLRRFRYVLRTGRRSTGPPPRGPAAGESDRRYIGSPGQPLDVCGDLPAFVEENGVSQGDAHRRGNDQDSGGLLPIRTVYWFSDSPLPVRCSNNCAGFTPS